MTIAASFEAHRDAVALMRAARRQDTDAVLTILSLPVEYDQSQFFNALAGLASAAFDAPTEIGFDSFADAYLVSIDQTQQGLDG